MLYTFIIIIPIINGYCQIMLKRGSLLSVKKGQLLNLNLVLGYFGLFIITLLTTYLLTMISLKSITIIIALNYLSTLLFSWVFLKENISKRKLLGTLLVMIGVIIFTL